MSIVLFSGGIDSTVLLADCIARSDALEPIAVGFDYGQRHIAEMRCARQISEHLGVRYVSHKISVPAPSTLTGSDPIHTRTLEEIRRSRSASPHIVPNRNAIFIATACAYAVACGEDSVLFGATKEDAAGFPDCRHEFVLAISKAMELACGVRVFAPFATWSKRDVIQYGAKIGAPLGLTYSCYAGISGEHCGVCDACLLRRDSFDSSNVSDPTNYIR